MPRHLWAERGTRAESTIEDRASALAGALLMLIMQTVIGNSGGVVMVMLLLLGETLTGCSFSKLRSYFNTIKEPFVLPARAN